MHDEEFDPGVIPDPRSIEEKNKDYKYEEIASASPLVWKEKTPSEWISYPIRNQGKAGTCVGFSSAKHSSINNKAETNEWMELSPISVYLNRKNQDSKGMWLQDSGDILCSKGICEDSLMPSDNLTEAQANDHSKITPETEKNALLYKGKSYYFIGADIDKIAQAIEDKGSVMLTFCSNYEEYTSVPKYLGGTATWCHCVAAVDYIMYEGKKALIIEDSWGRGGTQFGGRRIFKEDFLKARMTGCMVIIDHKPVIIEKPKHTFTETLFYSMRNDHDVEMLQKILQYEGFFPSDYDATGNYFEVTRKGVLAFQRKYKVASESELNQLNGRRVGPKTIKKLNELYEKTS